MLNGRFYIIVIMNIKLCTNGESVFTGIISNNEIYQKAPKHWAAYIDRFLQKRSSLISKTHFNYKIFLLKMLNNASVFVRNSINHISLETKRRSICFSLSCLYRRRLKPKSPSGKIVIYPEMLKWHRHTFEKPPLIFYRFALSFSLDKRLSLNLTVHHMLLSTKFFSCQNGKLLIYEFFVKYYKNSPPTLSFCGHHSEIDIFPANSSNLLVLILVQEITTIQFDATFSVIDCNVVKSFKNNVSYVTNSIFFWHLSRNNNMLSAFLIQVRKDQRFKFLLSPIFVLCYFMYDGPGSRTAILNPEVNHNMYVMAFSCSSFQCFVKILTNFSTSGFGHYYSIPLLVASSNEILNDTHITLHGYTCRPLPCVVKLWTKSSFQVNASIFRVSYKSITLYRPDCMYGGLYIFQGNNIDNGPLCQDINMPSLISRSYVSKNSSLLVILYNYEKYSDINATIRISLTKCKPVMFSQYDFKNYCSGSGNTTDICETYYSNITQGTSLFISSSRGGISFKLLNHGCVVLYVNRRSIDPTGRTELKEYQYGLNLYFSPEHLYSSEIKVRYDILGLFGQHTYGSKSEENIHFRKIIKNDEICFFELNETHEEAFSQENNCEQGFDTDLKITSSPVKDKIFMTTIITEAHVLASQLTFGTHLYLNSDSWIDIIIQTLRIEQETTNSKFDCLYEMEPIHLMPGRERFDVQYDGFGSSALHLTLNGPNEDKFELRNKRYIICIIAYGLFESSVVTVVSYPMSFAHLRNGKVIWLQNTIISLTITAVDSLNSTNLNLTTAWMCSKFHKSSQKMLSTQKDNQDGLCNVKHSILFGYKHCLQFSLHGHIYALYHEKNELSVVSNFFENSGNHTSWNEASKLCSVVGGNLPVFTSKLQLDELLAFLTDSSKVHPLEALFIGLKSNLKVRILELSPGN